MDKPIILQYEGESITLKGACSKSAQVLESCGFIERDNRIKGYRSEGFQYKNLVLLLMEQKIPYFDKVRNYTAAALDLKSPIDPRPHQAEALQAWLDAEKRASICMPTGSGKTILAVMAMSKAQRSTLVLVPTIDLMFQWREVLEKFFDTPIGMLGGGNHCIETITVSTYDSAHIHTAKLGNRFGLIVFDECHHLPAPQYQSIAISCIAPFRLGLSATFERNDGAETKIYELVGPLAYQARIAEMTGSHLAPYDLHTIHVSLTEEERSHYQEQRNIYLKFVRANRIAMGSPDGWRQFIYKSARSEAGAKAFQAYLKQKRIAQASEGKIKAIWEIITNHLFEKVIVFTHENAFAYEIGKQFFSPVLTHLTKAKERKQMLERFKSDLNLLITSRVLNEGVDVPDASVGIVVSGSSTVREHVQRLGRILRSKEGKRANLYEIISKGTGEHFVSERRRQHDAYQRIH